MMMNQSRNDSEGLRSMKTFKWKSVIWEMVAGLITISRVRSRRASIDLLRLSLEFPTVPLRTSGVLLAWSLRWLQEISYLSLERDSPLTRMMTIWLRWWRFLGRCPKILLFLESTQSDSLTEAGICRRSEGSSIGLSRRCLWRNTGCENQKLSSSVISWFQCWIGTLRGELRLKKCSDTHGSTWNRTMTTKWLIQNSRNYSLKPSF